MAERRKRRRGGRLGLGGGIRRLKMGAANAAEMLRLGRLTTPHRTQYDVVHQDRVYGLRRYHAIERAQGEGVQAPLLLIPPLMVTSEIYDMAPDLSAVSYLLGQGLDVWMVDFGAPERVEGRHEPHARRPRDRRLGRHRSRARRRGARRAPRRLLAGRHVLLPGGRLPAQRGHRVARHLRQPGRHLPEPPAPLERGDRREGHRRAPQGDRAAAARARGPPRLPDQLRLQDGQPEEGGAAARRVRRQAPRSAGAREAREPPALPSAERASWPGPARRSAPSSTSSSSPTAWPRAAS
ncbi:MAG: hypothetical protein M5U28_13340 [Sandaracinaceae bacterium]|nr:hypothetical protein [Sandaracinaceae bacterium]